MWKNKLSCFLFIFSFSLQASEMDLQFYDESMMDNQLGIFTSFSKPLRKNIEIIAGGRLFRTSTEWTRFEYKLDSKFFIFPWALFQVRAAHRLKLPAEFSDTTLMPQFELSAHLKRFKFFVSAGLYYRFVSVTRGSLIPFYRETDFSDWDFATQFGVSTVLTSQLTWLNRVSTFDEVETFNLNHPFIESSLFWKKPQKSLTWGLLTRYQILLGFGRLDRLMVGLSVGKDF